MQRRVLLSALTLPPLAAIGDAHARDARVPPAESARPLFTRELPNAPGQTFTSIYLTFPPGARAAPHRHGNAFVYAYVLDGAVRSQLDDRPAVVYRAGEGWDEAPGAHHQLTENASSVRPAHLLVVFVSHTGDALKVPDPQ